MTTAHARNSVGSTFCSGSDRKPTVFVGEKHSLPSKLQYIINMHWLLIKKKVGGWVSE
jgi:hypothetical protein